MNCFLFTEKQFNDAFYLIRSLSKMTRTESTIQSVVLINNKFKTRQYDFRLLENCLSILPNLSSLRSVQEYFLCKIQFAREKTTTAGSISSKSLSVAWNLCALKSTKPNELLGPSDAEWQIQGLSLEMHFKDSIVFWHSPTPIHTSAL